MIYFDVTKTGDAGHRSGLTRVSQRLLGALGEAARPVRWPEWPRRMERDDWLFTSELFSEDERPGVGEFLRTKPCRCAALFHDAIPLRHPTITWPQSVARHPGYLKLLARFDRVWAVSDASRRELAEFWRWQGVEAPPPIEVLPLGADFDGSARVAGAAAPPPAGLLSVGIIEPRKNQALLLDVAMDLWRAGLKFELHLVGRTNPHFGDEILRRIKAARREFGGLHYHAAASDAEVAQLYAAVRASVFPTIAEGCGLPLLESLWRGVPCVCSDLPVLRENADAGGCLPVAVNDRTRWAEALRQILTDDLIWARLATQARSRALPTWNEAAMRLVHGLRSN
jgi:glycosyltransferase involved in cell wall biosynthesis